VKQFSLLWILPFTFFIAGYLTFSYWFAQPLVSTPTIIGMDLSQAALKLAEQNLNFRLLSTKEDNEIPANTVVHQLPQAGQLIRPQSSIFCVISKKGDTRLVPHCEAKHITEIIQELKKAHLQFRFFALPNATPTDYCFAQFPPAGQDAAQQPLIMYISQPIDQRMIIPSFIGSLIKDTIPLLDTYDLKTEIVHQRIPSIAHECTRCKIVEQKPLAGSIINLQQSCTLQFLVE
jgi:beta-lactam-binding protein with PASTA domain